MSRNAPMLLRLTLGLSLAVVFSVAAYSVLSPESGSAKQSEDSVKRGKYLVTVLGCADCHTPHDEQGRPIAGRELSGHPEGAPLPEWDQSMMKRNAMATIAAPFTAFAGPFGTAIAPNLTPDEDTGIGKLTAEGLIKSWKTGRHWRYDRAVMPPMPVEAYGKLTEEDIRAIHAYLMSLPPVKNHVRSSFTVSAAKGQ
jgi:mono/diheme cytochrome c family protein